MELLRDIVLVYKELTFRFNYANNFGGYHMKRKVKILGNILFFGGLIINLLILFSDFLVPKWLIIFVYLGIGLRGFSDLFLKDSK